MATITLTAKVRDFKADHPDFENRRGPAETGLVKHVLGADNKPVFNRDRRRKSSGISSETSFNQWFRTTDGINIETDITLILDNGKPEPGGIYRVSQDPFFPIDNALFGNIRQELFRVNSSGQFTTALTAVGQRLKDKKSKNSNVPDQFNVTRPEEYISRAKDRQDHNYHFTVETSASFTYQGDEAFTFAGDDDLWVFLGHPGQGNLLVIDLGGVHPPLVGTLDLRLINPKNRATDPSTRLLLFLKEDVGIESAPPQTPLELKVGETYDLFFFSAERHTFGSKFSIETSLALKPPLPRVRLDATQSHAQEPRPPLPAVAGELKISLMAGAVAPPGGLTVRYVLEDVGPLRTARREVDYRLNPAAQEVVIPAGANSLLITVLPLGPDSADEPQEEVVARLITFENCAYELGDQVQDTVFITNFVPPLAKIIWLQDAIEPRAGMHSQENPGSNAIALFQVSLEGDLPLDVMTVRYRVIMPPDVFNATPGVDYEPLSGTVVVDKNNGTATIPVIVKVDLPGDEAANPETVVVELLPDPTYRIPAPGAAGRLAQVLIIDQPLPPPPPVLPLAQITASQNAVEPRPGDAIAAKHIARFNVTLAGDIGSDVTTVRYRVITPGNINNAIAGLDYEPLSGTVNINKVNPTAQISVVARADIAGNEAAAPEAVVVELLPDPAYRIPAAGTVGQSAVVTITDEPLPPPLPVATLQAVGDALAREPAPGRPGTKGKFLITLNPKPPAPVVVFYRVRLNVPKAAQPRDYRLEPLPEQGVQISPATGQGMITVTPKADNKADQGERVDVVLVLGTGYTLHTNPQKIKDVISIVER